MPSTPSPDASALPLSDIRVLDFGHTVMGPSAAMILADLGADVIKIEPAQGDPTRKLKGFGTGYFGYFNRNKRSIAVDLKTSEGQEIAGKLIANADVLIENFAPGTMERLALGYDTVSISNPRLIYASLKGFLAGPYEKRLALDEVVQMMSGLAYMTGPTGKPLRAGTSVIDIAGAMFAVIAILTALRQRETSGSGQRVESALFETAVFLMGQHLSYSAQVEGPISPMPERVSAWAVYQTFALADGSQMFVGITTDSHWQRFCAAIERPDLAAAPDFATNNARIHARDRLLPILERLFSTLDGAEAAALCEQASIPFAPIARPEDLFTDPHLLATGGLMDTVLPNGVHTRLPLLPISFDGMQRTIRRNPPSLGQDTADILSGLGLPQAEIEALMKRGIVAANK